MATASEAVDAAYSTYLNRTAGASGKEYWTKTWESDYQKAIDAGQTSAQAEAAATASINKHIGGSTEGKTYAKTGITKTAIEGTTGYGNIDETPDWYETNFTADDPNEYATGTRDEDWSTKLSTSNLENYLDTLNYQYGQFQGNTVGQEGSEWWGYQKTQAIDHYMSNAGGNYSFATASQLADHDIAQDITQGSSHQNYKKFGRVGYGNPLEIITSTDPSGDILTEERYLNLHHLTNLNPTGTKQATQYQIDEDGEFVLDDDGNKIGVTNEDGTTATATPYSWQYVPDSTAPGGYRITPVAFDTGAGDSTVGHDYHMANYQLDHGGKNPFTIPSGVQNVNANQFGPNGLTLAQWAQTPAGKADIAAGNFGHKNQGFTVVNGQLTHTPNTFDHTKYDSNLGLGYGENVDINWGGGYVTGLAGGPAPAGWVPPVPDQQAVATMGGGGNTIIQVDQNQKSTTAADKATKQEDLGMYSGQGRRGFSTGKYQPTGNISTLGIGGV